MGRAAFSSAIWPRFGTPTASPPATSRPARPTRTAGTSPTSAPSSPATTAASAFRAQLDEKLDLAHSACARLALLPALEIVAPPDLSLFAFRVRADAPGSGDPLTRRLAKRVNARNRVIVTGVEVHGRWLLRVCVLSFRTHAADLDALYDDVVAALAEDD